MKKQYFSYYKELEDIRPFVKLSRCFACHEEIANPAVLVCPDCFGFGHAPKKVSHLPRSHSKKKS